MNKDRLLVFVLKLPDAGNRPLFLREKPYYFYPRYLNSRNEAQLPVDVAFLIATKRLGEVYAPHDVLVPSLKAEQYEDSAGGRHDFEFDGRPVVVEFFVLGGHQFVPFSHRYPPTDGFMPDIFVQAIEGQNGIRIVTPIEYRHNNSFKAVCAA